MNTRYVLAGVVALGVIVAVMVGLFLTPLGDDIRREEAPSSISETFPDEAQELRALKEVLMEDIKKMGADKAYAQFLEDVDSRDLAGHSQVHAFGEALYEIEGLEGMSTCDSSYEFGCYHSFFGIAVQYEGIESLPRFDESCSKKYGDMNLPCQHGIGHGVLVYTDYDNVVDALELCETISDLPTGGCSSGVFMEYNFHTMDDSAGGSYIRPLNEANPHEPCDALPERFHATCYFEQVQWWQNVYHQDFEKIGALCSELPKDSAEYRACYNGAGNYIAATEKFDVQGIIAQCEKMPAQDAQGMCHEGASWLVIPEEDGIARAKELCSALVDPYKSECLQKLP